MFFGRKKFILCAAFVFSIILGSIENARAGGVCTPVDPTVVINPASNSGAEKSALGYTLTVTNNDVVPCVNRTFSLTITLPAAPCLEDSWTETLPLNTPAIAPGGSANVPFTVTSCRGPYVSGNSFTFSITAWQGANSDNDSATYDITSSSSEICDNGVNDDGDADVDCADADCLGHSFCCGNNIIQGAEVCDGITGCAADQICKANCSGCLNLAPDPADTEPCEIRGKVGGLVPCGRVLNDPATPWNETAPCNLCHVVPLIYNIIQYLLGIVGIIAILSIVLGMLMSITAIGGAGGLATIKMVISKTIYGFVAVMVAWLIVNLAMVLFGFDDPLGDGSWRKINCNLDASFCGDGIVNGTEVCEPGVSTPLDCETELGVGPAYCAGTLVDGKRFCNCTCDGYKDCTALDPTPVDGNFGDCSNATTYVLDYACCDLVACGADACCGGSNSGPSGLPGGYTFGKSLPFSGGNCVIGYNGRNWAIGINHTTGYFSCWK